jgi:hypothetical protein
MLNREQEWTINFDFDWLLRPHNRSHRSHTYRRGGGGFRALFIHRYKSFMKDIGDREIITRLARSHPIEIGAPWRIIER